VRAPATADSGGGSTPLGEIFHRGGESPDSPRIDNTGRVWRPTTATLLIRKDVMEKAIRILILPILLFIVGCGERNAADVAGPFRLLGRLQTRGWPQDVAVDDTLAAVADDEAGTAIVDIRDPAALDTIRTYPVSSYSYRVTLCILSLENGVFGPYNESYGGPQLYEIFTSQFVPGGFSNSLEVYKMELVSKPDTLQLFTGDRSTSDGFTVRMIAKSGDSWNPVDNEQFQYTNGFRIYGFGRSGELAALCYDQLGIFIWNWRTSDDSIWVDTPGGARDAVWVGDYIYVADYGNGVQVIDATSLATARIVASIMPPGSSRLDRIAADDSYLFVLDANDGIYVLDISTPNSPRYLQLLETPAPNAVVARDGRIYVADSYRGLLIYGTG